MMFKLFSLSSDMCAYTKCHVVTVFSSTVRCEEQVSGCTVCLSGRACTKGGLYVQVCAPRCWCGVK